MSPGRSGTLNTIHGSHNTAEDFKQGEPWCALALLEPQIILGMALPDFIFLLFDHITQNILLAAEEADVALLEKRIGCAFFDLADAAHRRVRLGVAPAAKTVDRPHVVSRLGIVSEHCRMRTSEGGRTVVEYGTRALNVQGEYLRFHR